MKEIKFSILWLISYLLCPLSLIPGFDLLIWVALVPLLVVNCGCVLQSVGWSYSFGIIFFIAIAYGLIPNHLAGFLFYSFVASLFFPIFTLILWYVSKFLAKVGYCQIIELFALPVIWVSLEYIFQTCFSIPFNLGLQQYRHRWIIQIASITGIYGISFLIVLVNSYLALCWRGYQKDRNFFKNKFHLSMLGLVLLLVILNGVYGWCQVEMEVKQEKGMIHVAGLQGNIPSWQYDLAPIFTKYMKIIRTKYLNKMIKEASEKQPDIIILPEGATSNFNFRIPQLRNEIYCFARQAKTWLLVGSLDMDERGKVYNSVFVVDPHGNLIGRYDKVKLAPFGEGLICSGNNSGYIKTNLSKIGLMICWESTFPQIARKISNQGAEILFVLTNDGDFRISTLPLLHAAEAIFRAVENGRWVVRVANFGLSMVISPTGEVVTKSDLCREEIIHAMIKRRTSATIYTTVGDIFSWLCLISTIFLGGMMIAKRNQQQLEIDKYAKEKSKFVPRGYISQLKHPWQGGIVILIYCLMIVMVIVSGILTMGYIFQPERTIRKHLGEFFFSPRLPIEEVRKNFLQVGSNTCGPAALSYLLNLWGVETSEQAIGKWVNMEKRGTSMYELIQATKKLGFAAWGEKQNFASLKGTILPVIAFMENNHWVVVLEIKRGFVTLFDPAVGYIKVKNELFNLAWSGYVMLVRTKPIPNLS